MDNKDIEKTLDNTEEETIDTQEENQNDNQDNNLNDDQVEDNTEYEDDLLDAEELTHEVVSAASSRYVNISDKYEDAKSTAATLLIVGICGLIFIIGSVSGILEKFIKIPITYKDNLLMYIVMTVLFIIFTIIGVYYVFKTKEYKGQIAGEVDDKANITKYFEESVSKESIDSQIDGELSEAELYFKRFEILKNALMREYENVDEALIEKMIDDNYDNIFTKES